MSEPKRGRGRPRLPAGAAMGSSLTLRLSAVERAAWEAAAARYAAAQGHPVTLAQYVRVVMEVSEAGALTTDDEKPAAAAP